MSELRVGGEDDGFDIRNLPPRTVPNNRAGREPICMRHGALRWVYSCQELSYTPDRSNAKPPGRFHARHTAAHRHLIRHLSACWPSGRGATYDLAKQVRRSLHHFWPRAESNLYAEAKRLVTGGYAVARVEQDGGRSRSVYMITPRGRKVLRSWLGNPGGETRLESEPLMKVFFADQGTRADLLETIKAMGQAAEQQREALRSMAEEYRVGTGPFPERLAIGVMAIGLVWDQLESNDRVVSASSRKRVERWSRPGPRRNARMAIAIFFLRPGRTATTASPVPRASRRDVGAPPHNAIVTAYRSQSESRCPPPSNAQSADYSVP